MLGSVAPTWMSRGKGAICTASCADFLQTAIPVLLQLDITFPLQHDYNQRKRKGVVTSLIGKYWLKIIKSCVSALRGYRNWPEVIASSARKQFSPRYILRDGTRFEATGGFKERWEIADIFFKRAYLPKPLTIWPDDVVIDIGANVGVFR